MLSYQIECNCRIKIECPINGECQEEYLEYKVTALTISQPKKSVSLQNLKIQDIITTPKHLKRTTIPTVQLFLIKFWKQRKQKKKH